MAVSSAIQALVVCTLLSVTSVHAQRLLPRRLHFVAQSTAPNTHNFFFRGSLPHSSTGALDFDSLTSISKFVASRAGVVVPEDVYVVDYSLLTNLPFVGNSKENFVTQKYFDKFPWRGEQIVAPVLGSLTSPSLFPASVRSAMLAAPSWLLNSLPHAIDAFHTKLQEPRSKPTLFYVHCMAGCDRTGIFVGAYMMRHMGASIEDAWTHNVEACGRAPSAYTKNSLEWYCHYLQDVLGFSMQTCELNVSTS
eukprot:GILK01012819.1.p1 GENE.GILK01012819.1~~GILK01012819.1.p1  ORF type:complete len:250 (-),score=24.18 GILK01012819.1:64-813(-)